MEEKLHEQHRDKSIELWKGISPKEEYSLIYTWVEVFSLALGTFLLCGYCELMKSASKQCVIHFLGEFPQPWVCSSYADWPSAFVSTLGMDLSQGLTQTTLVSVINLFTMKTVLRTRIFQLHLTSLSVVNGLIWEVKVVIKWLLSRHGIRREIHLTSWSSPQSVRVLSPDPLHIYLLPEGFCPWPGYHYMLIIPNCFAPASLFAELPIHLSNYQSSPPLGCSPCMCPKQNGYFPSPKPCPSPAAPSHLMATPISHLLRTKT